MVVGQILPSIPPMPPGPKRTQKKGKTPILNRTRRTLIDAIDTTSLPSF